MGILSRILDRRRGTDREAEILVHLHRSGLGAVQGRDAYLIEVVNASAEHPATVTHVWIETPTRLSVLTRPLPVTIPPGEQWETWIETRELPPAPVGAKPRACVAFGDETVVASTLSEHEPPA